MVPTEKRSPGLWVLVKVAPQLSVVVGAVQVTTAPHRVASLVWLMSAGMPAMAGFSLSTTVTVKEVVTELFAASVAV